MKTISLPKCCQINVRQLLKISTRNNASKSYEKMITAAGQKAPPPPPPSPPGIGLIVKLHFALSFLYVGVDIIILHVGNSDSINILKFSNLSRISLDEHLLVSFVPTCKTCTMADTNRTYL